ncbi:hypothetical protein [Aquimarina spinulae]|uniref:hypothetical protein n=1 Tax=Aquimarina spinulae TaxID=1192023 RepID=UPI000D55147B|nr:hypothetical protein [Aquimarina spinulae]
MKKQIFVLAILAIMISSCSGDDDTNTNTDNNTIIGTWILESTTEQDYNQNKESTPIGCDTNATKLIFDKETIVTVNSMVVIRDGSKLCVSGSSEEITKDSIVLSKEDADGNFGTFPPPKDIFSYKLQGDILTLTDQNNDDFVFKRAN